eukprot:TRINITY_DN1511_c0_g2_i2.p1 TRINITY_DN1511_c0_g2~~TRINITY_DN1511_c0_g2_i2.p1  ORF type:complete len:568 (-),score=102.99 TRINITY_DN1511_c0_g2_i2:532-2235(-)
MMEKMNQEQLEQSLTNEVDHLGQSISSYEADPSSQEEGDHPGRSKLVRVPEKRGWRKLLAYVGPGFLVAIAYIDPGNFESDLQAGALFKYELLWVLFWASVAGLLIQSLAANLGVVTGKHLAEHCRAEYPKHVNHALWVVAELAIVASDIPEVIGTAFALWMLFGIEVWIGVILTGFSTLILLALQTFGVRKLEIFISLLVFVIAACFFVEMGYASPNFSEIIEGLVVPRLRDTHATAIAISLVGAVVMPHNLYLHSALVLSRKVPRTTRGILDGCWYNLVECTLALLLAFAINVSVITVSGSVCSRTTLSPQDRSSCSKLDLNEAPFLLRNTLGSWSSQLFAVALLASGQSSTITGTYAGQYVMQGFLEMRLRPWLRNFLTRCVAILPSLFVALIGGTRGAGRLIIISSMVLSFELPFALLPLLKFTSSPVKMGPFVNPPWVTAITWVIGIFVCIANLYYVCSLTLQWLGQLSLGLQFVLGIVVFGFLLVYVSCICYLAIRPDSAYTFLQPDDDEAAVEADVEQTPVLRGKHKLEEDEEDFGSGRTPRDDIVQMQLPGDIHSGHAI